MLEDQPKPNNGPVPCAEEESPGPPTQCNIEMLMDDRHLRQVQVGQWCKDAFGDFRASNVVERGMRLLEESIEAAQAAGVSQEMAHKLVSYVFSQPVGELGQELGGVGVTTLALAEAAGLSAESQEIQEVVRVLSKPLEHFRQRHAAKDQAGVTTTPVKVEADLSRVCYTGNNCGTCLPCERRAQDLDEARVVVTCARCGNTRSSHPIRMLQAAASCETFVEHNEVGGWCEAV